MGSKKKRQSRFFAMLAMATLSVAGTGSFLAWAADDSLPAAIEAARKTHDDTELLSLKAQLEQKIAQNASDALAHYHLARIESYLLDVCEMRGDKKGAGGAIVKAIEAA